MYTPKTLKQIPPYQKEREPQLFDNQVRHHINEDNMQLPITTPDVQSVSFNSNIQTANFSSEDPPIQFHDMTHEPTFDQDPFFVEGSVPSANTQETPESIDTGDDVFSNNSNFLPSDSRFCSNRQYNLRRNDHLALARENSLYNLLQPSEKAKEEQVKVITYFPLDHIPDLTIDTTETDHDESIADSQATSSQSRNQSLNDFTFDSENLGDLFDDVNSPIYTSPILDTTGETLYRTNSINDIYNNTTSSEIRREQ